MNYENYKTGEFDSDLFRANIIAEIFNLVNNTLKF